MVVNTSEIKLKKKQVGQNGIYGKTKHVKHNRKANAFKKLFTEKMHL